MDSHQMKNIDQVYKKWEARTLGGSYEANSGYDQHQNSGKKAWQDKFGHNVPVRNRPPARYKTKKRRQNKPVDVSFQPLSETKFHILPAVIPAMYKRRRPIMGGACERCCKESKKVYEEITPSWGLHNILSMEIYKKQNLLRRSFCHAVFAWECNISHQNPYLVKTVLQSERVKSSILSSVLQDPAYQAVTDHDVKAADKERKKSIAKLEEQATDIMNGMAAAVYRTFVRFTSWFLMKLFGRLLSSIQIHRGQIDMLKEAAQDEKPLVFLPLHKSHLDYILITFVLVACDIKVPLVAAGDNLRIPVFSWILRHLGGFFIKRKLDHFSGKDELYKCVLQEYVERLLQSGQYLEFYIEGSRSRSGKAMVPKCGLLSLVVNAVMEGAVADVNIVPVNISYEKVVDSGYTRELLGERKTPESFWRTVKSLWRVLGTRYGNVRLDFGQPFSLQEFSRCMDVSQPLKEFAAHVTAKMSVKSSPQSSLLRNYSDLSLTELVDDRCFALTNALGYHVVYDAVSCCAVMSINIVAFLLLHDHRKGATLEALGASFDWLCDEITSRGRDVGFSGKTPAVIRHALRLLADDVTVTESQKDPEGAVEVHIEPKLGLPHVLNLTFYSNQICEFLAKREIPGEVIDRFRDGKVVALFAVDAVLACGIVSAADDGESYDTDDIDGPKMLTQSLIIKKAKDLCEILQREFIFVPPCLSLESALTASLEKFTASEILKTTEKSAPSGRIIGRSWGWDDEDEDQEIPEVPDTEYKLTASLEQWQKLRFLQSVVGPLVESYWVAACGLLWLKSQHFTESEFLDALLSCARDRVTNEVTLFPESCSLEPFRNAIRIFKEWNVVQVVNGSSLKLCEAYQDVDALFDVIENINQFRL